MSTSMRIASRMRCQPLRTTADTRSQRRRRLRKDIAAKRLHQRLLPYSLVSTRQSHLISLSHTNIFTSANPQSSRTTSTTSSSTTRTSNSRSGTPPARRNSTAYDRSPTMTPTPSCSASASTRPTPSRTSKANGSARLRRTAPV